MVEMTNDERRTKAESLGTVVRGAPHGMENGRWKKARKKRTLSFWDGIGGKHREGKLYGRQRTSYPRASIPNVPDAEPP
jgi:hypothetical protein